MQTTVKLLPVWSNPNSVELETVIFSPVQWRLSGLKYEAPLAGYRKKCYIHLVPGLNFQISTSAAYCSFFFLSFFLSVSLSTDLAKASKKFSPENQNFIQNYWKNKEDLFVFVFEESSTKLTANITPKFTSNFTTKFTSNITTKFTANTTSKFTSDNTISWQ